MAGPQRRLDFYQLQRVQVLHAQGLSSAIIAERMGVTRSCIYEIVKDLPKVEKYDTEAMGFGGFRGKQMKTRRGA